MIEQIRIRKTSSRLRAKSSRPRFGPDPLITIPARGFWEMPHREALQKTALDHAPIGSKTSCTTAGNHRGLLLAPLTLGIIAATTLVGRYMSRTGRYRLPTLAGTGILTLGSVLLAQISPTTSIWAFSAILVVFGFGIGQLFPVLTTAVQNAVPRDLLGTATASGVMFRQIGGSLAVAAFGTMMAARLASDMGGAANLAADMAPQALARLDPALRGTIAGQVAGAIAPIYWAVAGMALLGLLVAWRLREIPLANSLAPTSRP